MKKNILVILSMLIILSMLLTACGGAAPTEAPAPPAEATEAPEEPAAPEEPEETEEPATPEFDLPAALDAAYSEMLANMGHYNIIKAEGLMEELASDTPPFLLDVRTTAEVEENGHIEGAVHIPLDQLAQNLNVLPDFDTAIVAYCGSGWRATIAMTTLHGLGWTNVRALKTPFATWVEAGNPVVEGLPEPSMVSNDAEFDPALIAAFDEMLQTYGVKPFGIITADDLNMALAENPDLIIIDVRRAEELEEKGTIDTGDLQSIAIPLEDFIAMKDQWPATDAPITVYCGSGHRSTMALTILGSYGYQNINSLKGGFGAWAEAGYPVLGGTAAPADTWNSNFQAMLESMDHYNIIKAEGLMEELISDTPPFLLDVRTTAEVEENGHIEGAVHIPLDQLAQNLNVLPDFDTAIVAYCGSGWRATIAMTTLHGLGWTNVRALKTPFATWVEAGNPVVEGLPEPSMVSNDAEFDPALIAAFDEMLQTYGVKPFGIITADDLNMALAENPDLIIIDVRRAEELEEKGTIDTGDLQSIAIPLEDFIAMKDQWPATDAPITVYCGSGHRSTMALTILGVNGYQTVSSLKGGFGAWAEAGYPVLEYAAP